MTIMDGADTLVRTIPNPECFSIEEEPLGTKTTPIFSGVVLNFNYRIFLAMRRELESTLTLDMAMANAAIMGFNIPKAASGMPIIL